MDQATDQMATRTTTTPTVIMQQLVIQTMAAAQLALMEIITKTLGIITIMPTEQTDVQVGILKYLNHTKAHNNLQFQPATITGIHIHIPTTTAITITARSNLNFVVHSWRSNKLISNNHFEFTDKHL
jgi:urease beta subunit